MVILFVCTNHSMSVGNYNKYGHPHRVVLVTLNNSKIYRTDRSGSIMFKIKDNKLKIDTCSSCPQAQFWTLKWLVFSLAVFGTLGGS